MSHTTFYPIIRPSLPRLDEIAAELGRVLQSGMVTTSEYTRRFEAQVAEYVDAEHVIAVSSCTSGLMLVLRALGLSGEVIVPSFTFTATGLAAVWSGLTPVFCDCVDTTLTLDPDSVAAAIGPKTTAIMPVPVFGVPCDIEPLLALARERGLKVVFDSAQALGATYKGRPQGGFGDAEVFSLSPTKVITAVEGGLITTQSGELARDLRRMRDYGKNAGGSDITDLGLSARFSEVHAVIGSHNLARAAELRAARRRHIARMQALLGDLPGARFLDTPPDRQSSGIYMVMRVDPGAAPQTRDELISRLAAEGVQAKAYFAPPLHRQAVYANVAHRLAPSLRVSERAAAECMAIPLYADMSDSEIQELAGRVRVAYLT
jgi:dTDP-4-amino-4,6-dideoxygalactose transaminase